MTQSPQTIISEEGTDLKFHHALTPDDFYPYPGTSHNPNIFFCV